VSALIGQQAVLRAVDEATGRWGHLLLDTIVMCDQPVSQPDPARITLWADHGRDFYAPITFSNMPEDRVVWLGWMSNWAYAAAVPTDPWRGQQSLPRQLELTRTPRGLRLRQRVVDEVRALLEPQAHLSLSGLRGSELAALIAEAAPIGRRLMARFAVPVKGLKSPVGIELLKGAEAVRLGYDPEKNTFFVDRTTKQPKFSGQSERHDAERLVDDEDVVLEVWIDGSTLELFADGGTVVISDLVYADHAAVGVSVFYGPEDPIVQTFEVQAVSPAA
jgi:sucrose-6-phosphate hydrolase SacC (GH32 family)